MYANILKKDLKRKKTMNVILLLFSILASMFVSSGLSNVISVMNGTEYFLDKAGIGDLVIITQNGDGGVNDLLKKSKNVTDFKKENCYWAEKKHVVVNGKKMKARNNLIVLQACSNKGIKLFQSDNQELKKVKKGEVYVSAGFLDLNDASVGETIKVNYHGVNKTYKIAGEIKDALLGSTLMENVRLVISEDDFNSYKAKEKLNTHSGNIFNIYSDRVQEVSEEVASAPNVLFSGNRDMIKLCYIMEMLVAMIVLVLSVVLCVISFVLLKFVINFTINEEVREIGVMKAIGIKNRKIRSLYITKYFVMSVLGGVIGFFAGIPFEKVMLDSVSKKMVLGQDYGLLLNLTGAFIVIIIMIGFAYRCTAKIKKYTPVDAIRDGQKGERFGKRTKLSLSKSKWNSAFFMAINDVASAPKRFITIIISFFICSVFAFGLVLVVDTMKSDRLIESFGKKSDVYITDPKLMKMEFLSDNGNSLMMDTFMNLERNLKKLGMPADISMEVWYKYPVYIDGQKTSITLQQNRNVSTTEYGYIKGTAPKNVNEVAITEAVAKEFDVEIGDTITIDLETEKRDCVITGFFMTMNQAGRVMRIHQDVPTSNKYASAMMAFQLDFKDKVSGEEVDRRIKEIKKFYKIKEVLSATEYCEDTMGVADTMDAVAKLLLTITCIVVVLVTVLMERSFISDEKSQIALLKAIGFNNRFVIRWQVYRFMIVAVLSEAIAVALTYPVTKLWADQIFGMMGSGDVNYFFKPLSLLVIYPGIVLIISVLSIWLTARYTNKITCNDVRNIE